MPLRIMMGSGMAMTRRQSAIVLLARALPGGAAAIDECDSSVASSRLSHSE